MEMDGRISVNLMQRGDSEHLFLFRDQNLEIIMRIINYTLMVCSVDFILFHSTFFCIFTNEILIIEIGHRKRGYNKEKIDGIRITIFFFFLMLKVPFIRD